MRRNYFRVIAVAVCLLGSAGLLPAQSTNSQITGIVKDSSGGSIAGAEVTVANLDTGIERTVATNDLGYYTCSSPAITKSPAARRASRSSPGRGLP